MGILNTPARETREGILEAEDSGVVLSRLFGGPPTATGKRVDGETARKYSAYFGALRYSVSHMGTLPLKLYERQDDGGRAEVRQHPAHHMVHQQANREMSASSLREALHGHVFTRGNNYAEIVRNGRQQATELWPLNPKKTELTRDDSGTPFYETTIDGERRRLAFDRVLHVPGLGFDGRTGYSVLSMAREAIGLGLAGEEYSARFFSNNATPSGVLQSPTELSPEAKQKLKQQWEQSQGGLRNQHRVAVLEGDITWQELGIPAEDAQLLEMRQFQVRDISRYTGIPPHKLMELSNATFSNIESQDREVLIDHLRPWAVRWEQALNHKVLTDNEKKRGLFFKFNFNALLRANTQARAEKQRTEITHGLATINEIRALEERNPIDSEFADTPLVRGEMIPLDMAGRLRPSERALMRAVEEGDPETVRSLAELRKAELTTETEERTDHEQRSIQRRRELVNTWRPLFERDFERMVRAEITDIRAERQILAEEGVDAFVAFLREFYEQGGPIEGLIERTTDGLFRQYARAASRVAAETLEDADPLTDLQLDTFVGTASDGQDTYLGAFANRYARTSRQALTSAVQQAADAEDATPDEALDRELGGWQEGTDTSRPRSEVKAQWEANQEANAVAKATFAAAGVTLYRWQAVGSSCPLCERLDGMVVDAETNFVDEGDELIGTDEETTITPQVSVGHPPIHGGCDCLVVPESG